MIVASRRQLSADLADDAVIVGLDDGVYYSLNEVGRRIWTIIQEPRAVEGDGVVLHREPRSAASSGQR